MTCHHRTPPTWSSPHVIPRNVALGNQPGSDSRIISGLSAVCVVPVTTKHRQASGDLRYQLIPFTPEYPPRRTYGALCHQKPHGISQFGITPINRVNSRVSVRASPSRPGPANRSTCGSPRLAGHLSPVPRGRQFELPCVGMGRPSRPRLGHRPLDVVGHPHRLQPPRH